MARHPSLVLGACLCLIIIAGCSDDATNDGGAAGNDDATAAAQEHDPDASPMLREPPGAYSILQPDLAGDFLTDIGGTYVLNAETYSVSKAFPSEAKGYELLTDWGYTGGYETGYIPEGREQAVLNGAYYFAVESHLFEDEEGAKQAFRYINERLTESPVASETFSGPVGNEWKAWESPGDVIPGSSANSVHHRMVFRRGNMLAMVATWGAEHLTTIRRAYELALIIDEKALGERETTEPTPTTNGATSGDGATAAGG
jgi:hypothetical protein